MTHPTRRTRCFAALASLTIACDATPVEMSTTDAGTTDAGTIDAGTTDAGTTDAGIADAGTTDAVAVDAWRGEARWTVDPATGVETVSVDAPAGPRVTRCEPSPDGLCALSAGRYVPVADGPAERVWAPPDDRYVNEPTLIRGADGVWHVFSNGGAGGGGPRVEVSLLHATAPSLAGPWRAERDALSMAAGDPVGTYLWAPFVIDRGGAWWLWWYSDLANVGSVRAATSTDLTRWSVEPEVFDGGRDVMLLRAADGRWLRYSTGVAMRADGPHDTVRLHASADGRAWRELSPALEHPRPCRDACWGFFESPYVIALAGRYYLFTTYTDSARDTYEQTVVLRSDDPTRFTWDPVATLRCHGAEVHADEGRAWLTCGGWAAKLDASRRGLSRVPIAWVRDDRP